MKSYPFNVQGVTCGACVKIIKKRLAKIADIGEVTVDLSGHLEIQANRDIHASEVSDALKDTDYTLLP